MTCPFRSVESCGAPRTGPPRTHRPAAGIGTRLPEAGGPTTGAWVGEVGASNASGSEGRDDNGPLAERMSRAFPWMLALSPDDRATCAQDLVDAARASFSTDQPHLVLAELTSWKETATAIAAGLNRGEPEWLDDDDAVVERP